MYESPINITFQNIQEQIAIQTERDILEIVRKCGIDVDKDELIKAINYDRNQYNKGYVDGCNDTLDRIRAEMEETYMNITDQENDQGAWWGFRKALWIICKYKVESEGKK